MVSITILIAETKINGSYKNYNAKTFRKENPKNKRLWAELGLAQDEEKVHDRYRLPSDQKDLTSYMIGWMDLYAEDVTAGCAGNRR